MGESGAPPALPGTYIWPDDQGHVLYIGSAKLLAVRLGAEQRWVDQHDPASMWEVTVIHGLKRLGATPRWITTTDYDQALRLEGRHLIEWHRACVGIAPILVG